MAENNTVHAPYNFVPFSNKVLLYGSMDKLPYHDEIRHDLKSGEIHITLEAQTPVFVSDGHKSKGMDGQEFNGPHFFRTPNGKYAIPGSTVRGMTRENMQILSFGLVRRDEDLKDYQIYYRVVAATENSVHYDLKKTYHDVMGIKENARGEPVSDPRSVRIGYLYNNGMQYQIIPASGPVFRVSRQHPDVQQFGKEHARVIHVAYQATGKRVDKIIPVEVAHQDLAHGELLYTGKWIEGRDPRTGKPKPPNHLYLFPEPVSKEYAFPVENKDVISYLEDLEARRNNLGKDRIAFWELPKAGESKPVFYVQHAGHLYFGMSRYLRIGYQYPLSEGLPEHHRKLAASQDICLDYPHAILGFVTIGGKEAYKSRVSFGDVAAQGNPKECSPVRAVLGAPKPSYYPGYVVDGKNYNEAGEGCEENERFHLRGYKQYWMKPVQETSVAEGKDRVGSTLRPLPEGTRFQGIVRYKNLTEEELGLLLWSLRLDEGCSQTLGMGKPYGYGRMKLTIDELRELDYTKLYGSLDGNPWRNSTDRIDEYIQAYDEFAADKLHVKKPKKRPSITSLKEIQDFFYMKKKTRDDRYMELKEYQNVRSPLRSVEDLRKNDEELGSSAADSVTQSPDNPYVALQNKFKKL